VSTPSKRIAFISTLNGAPWGGSEELWAAAAEEALDSGWRVFISVPRWPDVPRRLSELAGHGADIVRRQRPRNNLSRRVQALLGAFREVARFRPQVVCISQGGTFDIGNHTALFRGFVKRVEPRIPFLVICQWNDDYLPLERTRLRQERVFRRAEHVIFVADANLRSAERQLAKSLPNARVMQNPTGVKYPQVLPWPESETPALACPARLDVNDKGQHMLFEALAAPEWLDRRWRLNLYGAGRDATYLQALANHLRIADRVRFCGHVNDVKRIWAENHLLVLPSFAEGIPLVLVEAMLFGRPVLCSNVGGMAEWVTDRETGFMADAPTVGLLRTALERAWSMRLEWQRMGERAHHRAMARRDPKPGATLLETLQDIVSRSRA
jgi:L-malate glycosyltransferase